MYRGRQRIGSRPIGVDAARSGAAGQGRFDVSQRLVVIHAGNLGHSRQRATGADLGIGEAARDCGGAREVGQ